MLMMMMKESVTMSPYLVAMVLTHDYLSLTAGQNISVVAPRQEIERGRGDYSARAAVKARFTYYLSLLIYLLKPSSDNGTLHRAVEDWDSCSQD